MIVPHAAVPLPAPCEVTAVTAPHCTHPSVFINGEEQFPNVPVTVVLSHLNDEPEGVDLWRFGLAVPPTASFELAVTWKLGPKPGDPAATTVTTPTSRLRNILTAHGIPADTADAIVTEWAGKATRP